MSVLWHLVKWSVGLAPPEVWTSPEERECLARHAAGKTRLAEVGVWHGRTSARLRAAMPPSATLFAIDPYQKGWLGFSAPRVIGRRELGRVKNGRVVWVRKTGAEAVTTDEVRAAPFDFVFIDDAQTYETLKAEWEAWAPLVAPGGIIAMHDTQPLLGLEQSSVCYAREVVLVDPRFNLAEAVGSVSVLRRRPIA